MVVINFSKTNCQNCYSCVRSCPVKAIKVNKGQAEVMESRCIACGLCLHVCPRNAKKIQSELELVKKYFKKNYKVAVSLAPSYLSVFGEHSSKVVSLLRKLGFTYIEETIVGAEVVTKHYELYKDQNLNKACITSCCPSVNLLIEKHYPQNIRNLIPVISPMVCHSRSLKAKYGNDIKVVFIGPCLSKKLEGTDEISVDAVLTFDELMSWIEDEKLSFNDLEEIPIDVTNVNYSQYPVVGGITKHFTNKQVIHVDGIEECIKMLEEINLGKFSDYLIEMSSCRHSCVGGSAMPNDGISVFERKMRIEKYKQAFPHNETEHSINIDTIPLTRKFYNKSSNLKQPNNIELETILYSMGKYTSNDQLNCGTCGYKTCKQKAVAIFNNMAEANMCLPFLKNKAETFSNLLFDVTPNIVLIIDFNLKVIEFNPAAECFFNLKKHKVIGMPVSIVLNADLFNLVLMNKKNILGKKQCINAGNSYIIQSIVWVEYHQVMLCIISDITETVKKEEWMKNLKINAVNMAQEVINKQMRVAQEIASLLGETTAETKVTLTRLKELIKEDEV
jgi:iron only hydrogenase large subunit-like protein